MNMGQDLLSIEAFNELLNKWNGKKIKIAKHEIGDDDETFMKLRDISYAKDTRRIDDYVPKHALQLNGVGEVENEDNELEPLPSSEYEIPLEDSAEYQFDGNKFTLNTDRGVYTIELAGQAE